MPIKREQLPGHHVPLCSLPSGCLWSCCTSRLLLDCDGPLILNRDGKIASTDTAGLPRPPWRRRWRIGQHRAPAVHHRREICVHRVVHLCRTAAPPLSGTNVANPPCRDERASPCTSPALVASRQPGSCHSELLLPRPARQLGNDSTAARRRSHPCPLLSTAYCLRHSVATMPVAGCERARR